MELRQLRTFEMVARQSSFSRAALDLNLSQPAVSSQIQALEQELGLKLLDRLPRQVLLTQAGEVLLGYARRLLNLEEEACAALAEMRGLRAGNLRVAASPTIGTYLLPGLLGEFKRRYPELRVIAEIEPSYHVVEALVSHSTDVGLIEAEMGAEGLVAEVFKTDELVLVVPGRHPWARRKRLRPQELLTQPLVAREPGSGTRQLVEERLQALGIAITPALELGGVEAIKNAVIAGLGVSFISRQAIRLEEGLGILAVVPVEGLDLHRSFYCLRSAQRYLSPALQAFLALVGEGGPASALDILAKPT